MIEVRPIRDDEADSFLELLCEVFDLDFARAQGIFYNEPMFDLHRKWALFENGRIQSILTTVPLEFGWGRAIGIAGVATRLSERNRGLAGELLRQALAASEAGNESAAFLFAKETTVYARMGFKVLDRVVRAPIKSVAGPLSTDPMPVEDVMAAYEKWSESHPDRLRRDIRRWSYWKWNFKVCVPFMEGYLCPEGSLVRECLTHGLEHGWPVSPGTNWLGLTTMAAQMGVPIGHGETELLLMGRNAPGTPQMFMTDQF